MSEFIDAPLSALSRDHLRGMAGYAGMWLFHEVIIVDPCQTEDEALVLVCGMPGVVKAAPLDEVYPFWHRPVWRGSRLAGAF